MTYQLFRIRFKKFRHGLKIWAPTKGVGATYVQKSVAERDTFRPYITTFIQIIHKDRARESINSNETPSETLSSIDDSKPVPRPRLPQVARNRNALGVQRTFAGTITLLRSADCLNMPMIRPGNGMC